MPIHINDILKTCVFTEYTDINECVENINTNHYTKINISKTLLLSDLQQNDNYLYYKIDILSDIITNFKLNINIDNIKISNFVDCIDFTNDFIDVCICHQNHLLCIMFPLDFNIQSFNLSFDCYFLHQCIRKLLAQNTIITNHCVFSDGFLSFKPHIN